ncbi:HNH endonuclease [Peptostreptococcus sp. D1]|uniref:HNH endonuclease n=1 Tax=Peptostreptococcus sp. D1 TaxID=72304 RepID=UPI0015A6EBFB|nr:HNH endonuclease [Peptostreptococcus sp. D1]
MTKIDDFIDNITPSNYFITKSMEMSKIKSSGTLWYTKKYIVLYDAIFISKKIDTKEGINEIIRNFNNYISTLPESVKDDAERFFFPKHADLRGDFRTYNEFAGVVDINEDKKSYYSNVNKYYFIYLMNIGGQSGVKAFIKEHLYRPDFEVSNLPEIIKEFQKNNPKKKVDITGTINDFHASLRNERQILFYYGYFHSRNNGAGNDNEFSSLTPIGEIAVKANSKEFSIIWEHQKIKMVSQPVTIEFPSIKNCQNCFSDKFKINYSPYFSILRCLEKYKQIFPRFYDRILSRSNNDNIDDIIKNYDEFVESIPKVETYLDSFNLRTENKNEDFEKEIKKYMLGIRTDFYKDNSENYLGFVSSTSNNGWILQNEEKFNILFKIYEIIENYKLNKYNLLFDRCEKELRKKYESVYTGNVYEKNHRIKMEWDLYNIKVEKTILFSLVICEYLIFNRIDVGSIITEQVYTYFNEYFINILKSLNLTKKQEIIREIKRIVEMIKVGELVEIDEIEENSVDLNYINQFSSLNTEDLRRKIIEVSMENIKPTLERKRDMRVISLLKKLQLIEYSDENSLIPCECCGEKTFIKNNNEPYIEYHHLIPFSIADGPDHFENIFGICPMCHRKIHFIKDSLKEDLYFGFNQNNHRKKNIADRLRELYKINALKSYQLEYALSEKMITEAEYEKIVA